MGMWNTNEFIPQTIDKKLIGISKFAYTKKYHPGGSVDKNKARLVFWGDKWYDI